MARENLLWKWLGKHDLPRSAQLEMNRIENMLEGGMPDVEGTLGNSQFWLELKRCIMPARSTTDIHVRFRPRQVPWLVNRWRVGGNAFVLLAVGEGHQRRILLVPGLHARDLEDGLPLDHAERLSLVPHDCKPADVLITAAWPRSIFKGAGPSVDGLGRPSAPQPSVEGFEG